MLTLLLCGQVYDCDVTHVCKVTWMNRKPQRPHGPLLLAGAQRARLSSYLQRNLGCSVTAAASCLQPHFGLSSISARRFRTPSPRVPSSWVQSPITAVTPARLHFTLPKGLGFIRAKCQTLKMTERTHTTDASTHSWSVQFSCPGGEMEALRGTLWLRLAVTGTPGH